LKSYSTNGKQCSTTVNWVLPDVNDLSVDRKVLLRVDRSFHFGEFCINKFREWSQPLEGFTRILFPVHLQEPSRRLGDEEHANGQ
jgi:hypothetical protein